MPDAYSNTTTLSRLLLAQLQDVYTPNWEAYPKQYPMWNTLVGSDTAKHTFDSLGNIAAAIEMSDGADLTLNALTQAYETAVTVKQWGTAHVMTYMLVKQASRNTALLKSPQIMALLKSMVVTLEKNAITPWDNAFTTNLADGVPMFDNAHPCKDTAGGSTWDNLATGAISYANVEAAIKLFSGFLDHQGQPVPSIPDTFKTHAVNQMALKKLFDSEYVPVDNQLISSSLPMLKQVFSNYLTSLTAWFIEDTSPDRPHGVSVYLNSCPQPENEVYKVDKSRSVVASSIYFMQSGMIPSIGIVGSTGL